MTIQQLFDDLRKETDWSKEVVVMKDDNFVPVSRVVPNLLDIDTCILKLKDVEDKLEWTPYSNGHYICGDYVLTGINNAFNDKRGFWISKKDCTKSFYCFTPINNSDLKKQLDNPQVWIDYFEKQMER